MPAGVDGDQQRSSLGVKKIRIGDRARCHHAQHLALDGALARRRIADLLADGDRFAEAHQPGEVLLNRVERNARHRDRRARRLPARGQRDVEQRRGTPCVVIEELVEIAHPVEEQLVRMLRLGAKVLLHHRRVRAQRDGGRGGSGRGGGHGGAIIDGQRALPPAFAADALCRSRALVYSSTAALRSAGSAAPGSSAMLRHAALPSALPRSRFAPVPPRAPTRSFSRRTGRPRPSMAASTRPSPTAPTRNTGSTSRSAQADRSPTSARCSPPARSTSSSAAT